MAARTRLTQVPAGPRLRPSATAARPRPARTEEVAARSPEFRSEDPV